jgi:hypothetical protein
LSLAVLLSRRQKIAATAIGLVALGVGLWSIRLHDFGPIHAANFDLTEAMRQGRIERVEVTDGRYMTIHLHGDRARYRSPLGKDFDARGARILLAGFADGEISFPVEEADSGIQGIVREYGLACTVLLSAIAFVVAAWPTTYSRRGRLRPRSIIQK